MGEYNFGHILMTKRKKLGISIEQASSVTKIRAQILEAFEQSNFDAIPPKGYAQGMLTSYARYLDLNARQILDSYNDDLREYEHSLEGRRSDSLSYDNPMKITHRPSVRDSSPVMGGGGTRSGVTGPLPRVSMSFADDKGRTPSNPSGQHSSVSRPYSRSERADMDYQSSSRDPYDDFINGRDYLTPGTKYSIHENDSLLNSVSSFSENKGLYSGANFDGRAKAQQPSYVSRYDRYLDRMNSSSSGYSRSSRAQASRSNSQEAPARRVIDSSLFDDSNAAYRTDDAVISGLSNREGSYDDYQIDERSRYAQRALNRSQRSSRNTYSGSKRGNGRPVFVHDDKKLKIIIIAIIAIVVIGAAIFFIVHNATQSNNSDLPTVPVISENDSGDTSENSSEASSDENTTSQESSSSSKSSTSEVVSDQAFDIKIELESGESSWIAITVDGESQYSNTATGPQTFEYTVKKSIQATIGKPTAVTVTQDGKEIEIPSSGGVGKLDLSVGSSSESSSETEEQ